MGSISRMNEFMVPVTAESNEQKEIDLWVHFVYSQGYEKAADLHPKKLLSPSSLAIKAKRDEPIILKLSLTPLIRWSAMVVRLFLSLSTFLSFFIM